VEETEELDITDTPVALLTVVSDTSTDHVQFKPARTADELEDDVEILYGCCQSAVNNVECLMRYARVEI
jgi:hypothetical protein